MAHLNKVLLIGNVGRDPEVKTFDGGRLVKFSLATTKSWNKDGEKKEMTTWHDITVFGKLSEIAEKYVKKGSSLYVEGELRVDTWDGEDGKKRSKWYVVAENFQMLGAKQATDSSSTTESNSPAPTKPNVKNYAPGASNDELPF